MTPSQRVRLRNVPAVNPFKRSAKGSDYAD